MDARDEIHPQLFKVVILEVEVTLHELVEQSLGSLVLILDPVLLTKVDAVQEDGADDDEDDPEDDVAPGNTSVACNHLRIDISEVKACTSDLLILDVEAVFLDEELAKLEIFQDTLIHCRRQLGVLKEAKEGLRCCSVFLGRGEQEEVLERELIPFGLGVERHDHTWESTQDANWAGEYFSVDQIVLQSLIGAPQHEVIVDVLHG